MAGQGFPRGTGSHGCNFRLALEDVQMALDQQAQVTLQLAARLSELSRDAEVLTAAAPIRMTSGYKFCRSSPVVSPNEAMTHADQPTAEYMPEVSAGLNQEDDMSQDVDEDSQDHRPKAGGLFSSTDELKEQIRQNLQDESYDATKFYKTTGPFQAIARAQWFEVASLVLVIISSFWLAVDLDFNNAIVLNDAGMEFQVPAHLICVLFVMELMVRFLAFKQIQIALKDPWCVFDLLLVIFMVMETWALLIAISVFQLQMSANNIKVLSVFRMLRLVRVMRLMKLLRFMPELLVIIRGIGIAMRAISLVFALLGMVIYIAAIIFRVLLEDTDLGREQFTSVAQAMGTLLLDCALSGTKGAPLMRGAWTENPIYGFLFFCFALLANVTMMGILGGLLVQTIKKVAEVEEGEKAYIQNLETMDDFWKHIVAIDENNDGLISVSEFFELLSQKKTVRLLKKMDVDPEALVYLSDFVFAQKNGKLSQEEFNRWVLDVRDNQKATLKDHMVTRKVIIGQVNQVLRMAANMKSTPDMHPCQHYHYIREA